MQKTYIKQFPYIRIFACFAIVVLHTLFASNAYYDGLITGTEKLVTQTAENMLMWAVPCFLMITGALLLDENKNLTGEKIFKYTRRMVISLLVFTLLFQILDYATGFQKTLFTGWLYRLFTGQSWAHMWYLYLMIGLYLMIPFYKMVADHATDRQMWGLIGSIVLFVSLLPLSRIFGLEPGFYIPTTMIYPAYLFLGHMFRKKSLGKVESWMLFLIPSVIIIMLSTYCSAVLGQMSDETFQILFGYGSIPVVLQTAGIYNLLMNIDVKERSRVNTLNDCSFGIYLIHMIFVTASMKWFGFNPYRYNFLIFIGMALVFFVAAFIITYILRKIPKVNTIL